MLPPMHICRFGVLYYRPTVWYIIIYSLYCRLSYRYEPLFIALPDNSYELLLKKQILLPEIYKLTDSYTTGVEHLNNGTIPYSLRSIELNGVDNGENLLNRKHRRQVPRHLWRLYL